MHISTGLTDPARAKVQAFAILCSWQQRILELRTVDVLKVSEGSALLAGDGLIRLADVAEALGISRDLLLTEVGNVNAPLIVLADGWSGTLVDDITQVERDFDGTYMVDDALARGQPHTHAGPVRIFHTRAALEPLRSTGLYTDYGYWIGASDKQALYFNAPGKRVDYDSLMMPKRFAERIRTRLAAGIPPQQVERAMASLEQRHTTPPATRHSLPFTEVLDRYCRAKARTVKAETVSRNRRMCEWFVTLMGDMPVADIDRQVARDYVNKLEGLPRDIDKAARELGTTDLAALIEAVAENPALRVKPETIGRYVSKWSELCAWAVTEDLMDKNPAIGLAGELAPRTGSDRSKREQFSDDDLAAIFGVQWFIAGAGRRNASGRQTQWRPHYYWLPLLSLYTGGRLNELSQIYLDDIQQTGQGHWYLDFNTNTEDKLNLDADDPAASRGDGRKSLKTVNSERKTPLHPKLIELGLVKYAQALRTAGYKRLFPELRYDATKGYGKSAGSWFNERFLGNRLKIERDGRKTFHSFRHNFTTAMFEVCGREDVVSQLNGHTRGTTESGNRYRKDEEVDELMKWISKLTYRLPSIAAFKVAEGLKAVEDALDLKRRSARRKKPQSPTATDTVATPRQSAP